MPYLGDNLSIGIVYRVHNLCPCLYGMVTAKNGQVCLAQAGIPHRSGVIRSDGFSTNQPCAALGATFVVLCDLVIGQVVRAKTARHR